MGLQVAIDPAKEPRKPQARVTWSDSPSQQVSYSREKKLQKWYEGERSPTLVDDGAAQTAAAAPFVHKRSSGRDPQKEQRQRRVRADTSL